MDGTSAWRSKTRPRRRRITIHWTFGKPATDWTDRQDGSTVSLTGPQPPPPPTPAGPGGLVSNVGQPAYPETFTFKWDRAQAFTTGSAPGGYRLTGVDIRLADTGKTALARTAYSVKLHEALPPHRGEPGRVLATLANPDSLPRGEAGGIARFTASGGVDLAPRSRYFVVIDVDGTKASRRVAASTAGSTAEDAGGRAGMEHRGHRLAAQGRLDRQVDGEILAGPSDRGPRRNEGRPGARCVEGPGRGHLVVLADGGQARRP